MSFVISLDAYIIMYIRFEGWIFLWSRGEVACFANSAEFLAKSDGNARNVKKVYEKIW